MCHAFLRLGQYLKAPNTIHDTHRVGHVHHEPGPARARRAARWPRASTCTALHRLRLDDRIDTAFAPVLALAHGLDRADRWLRRTLTADGPRS